MLEIYNEQVRDLLTKDNPKGGLPVSVFFSYNDFTYYKTKVKLSNLIKIKMDKLFISIKRGIL